MRFIGLLAAFCIAALLIRSLPGLWQRTRVREVRQVEASPSSFGLGADSAAREQQLQIRAAEDKVPQL